MSPVSVVSLSQVKHFSGLEQSKHPGWQLCNALMGPEGMLRVSWEALKSCFWKEKSIKFRRKSRRSLYRIIEELIFKLLNKKFFNLILLEKLNSINYGANSTENKRLIFPFFLA